jgi:alcohol dehydrogenase class IV
MSIYNFEFQIKTKIKFGRDKIKEIPVILKKETRKKLMVVVDQGIKEAGILAKVRDVLTDQVEYCIFDQVKPDPTLAIVSAGVKYAVEEEVDAILAVGGGSPIDSAKAIRSALESEKMDTEVDLASRHCLLITVPTTSGSGSEVTKTIVITDSYTKRKFAATSDDLAPEISIVDPELTRTLPASLTAIGGMDALSHCVEAYTSKDAVLPFEMIATKGIQMVNQNLRPAVGNPDNMDARTGMSLASLFGGIAFSNCGLGLVHAISHPLGGQFNIPHGLANAIILPYVMEFNIISNPNKFAHIANLFGVNIDNITEMEAAYKAVEEVKKIKKDIGLDYSLDDFDADKFEYIAELALKEKLMLKSNPRSIKKKDIIKILKKAY